MELSDSERIYCYSVGLDLAKEYQNSSKNRSVATYSFESSGEAFFAALKLATDFDLKSVGCIAISVKDEKYRVFENINELDKMTYFNNKTVKEYRIHTVFWGYFENGGLTKIFLLASIN